MYNEYYNTRERIKALESKASEVAPISSTTLEGQRLILEKEAGNTGIRKALEAAFGKGEADRIMALALYLICRGKALSRSPQWLEDRGFGELGLTSQRISELLGGISDDRVNAFFKK